MNCSWAGLALAFILSAVSATGDTVDNYLLSQMREHKIPGAALIVLQTNQPVKRAAYGVANLEWNIPATPETVFEIGSVTKQFTASCVLLLVQDGKLTLDDKIGLYLKNTPESWAAIRIRHLLTHTSGLKSYTGLDGFELRRHLTQAQFIEQMGRQPLEFSPGENWKYCNTGFNLLGFIIENVSGSSYCDFLARRILIPLGMNATTNRDPARIIPNRAAGYEQTNHIWINRDYDLTDVFSAGALVSTIDDLAKWNRSLDEATLLKPEILQQAWTPSRLNNGEATRYGFGWRIETFEGHSNIGHAGATSGFSASIQRFPDEHLAVILLTNTDEQIATTLARGIAQFYLPAR
ncbi:MAG TPA: serine hydrolase domain-containing protein [Verrucomicrobiae bacterium]|nr:serine hydrolase domain-containing protein [Verrucomicrobiae bacterium]